MQLDEVITELYGIPPEEFVQVRTERVKEARTAGDRELGTTIGKLRRPTKSAWLVNLAARELGPDLRSLLDLGEALREAQLNLAGDELRSLSGQRHAAVNALTKRVAELASSRGYQAGDAVLQEVSQTLQAALADPETGAAVRAGCVVQSANYGGFGPTADISAQPGASLLSLVPDRVETPPAAEEPGPSAQEVELARVKRELRAAEAASERAQKESAAAAKDAIKANAQRERLSLHVLQVREQLTIAEDQLLAAHQKADAAADLHQQRERTAAEASEAAQTLADAATKLETEA